MEENTPESQQEPEKQEETPKETSAPEDIAQEPSEETSAEVPEKTSEELLAESQKEIEKTRDLYMRARADLENYRRRVQKEKEDLIRFGNENIIRELLPVMDNLERAVEHARSESQESEGLLQGVEMTISQFQKAFEKFGASTFSAIGEPFDPGRHEAMGQLDSDEHPPNTVVQELQKGCLLNDRLLRPAMVIVSRAPEKKTPPDIEKN
ncbi:MAG: nucleotide exchange factor GrpE [Deltaproteobacteria bacterium]|nr:nucleotide exchange factor GrpE [Deltaproteobacteria bacterium]